MSKRDYYEVLGVSPTATEAEMKSAFRKLAMQCHPDRNPGDKDAEIKFKEINEAYQVLTDGQKRAAYDRFGHAAFANGGAGQHGFDANFTDFMSDIFENFFGETRGRRGPGGRERGADMRYNLEITLEEAYNGRAETITIPSSLTCEVCSGSGAKAGSKPRACPTCGGAGRITRERTLSVNVPAGVEDGTRIRLAGEGEAGLRGGPAGDLYIFLSIKPHAFFQRDAADLFCRVPISMVTASLGGEVIVPTLDGSDAKVKVPEGTQSGKQFRLKAKGMPVLRSRNLGDLYIQVVVETPQNLTRRQRELLQEFDRESSKDTQPESDGFFSRVREFFDGLGGSGRP